MIVGLTSAAVLSASRASAATGASADDERFMRLALDEARRGDYPFGAVIVRDGEVIARGRNLGKTDGDPTAHGEMVAIRRCLADRGRAALVGSTLYTSGEPCAMCMGAIIWCHIGRLVFAASVEQLATKIDQIMISERRSRRQGAVRADHHYRRRAGRRSHAAFCEIAIPQPAVRRHHAHRIHGTSRAPLIVCSVWSASWFALFTSRGINHANNLRRHSSVACWRRSGRRRNARASCAKQAAGLCRDRDRRAETFTGYVNEYAPRAQESIKKAGGKILAASLNVTQLEGPAPSRVVIQVWDSPEQIAAWAHGSDYNEIRKIGERYAIFRSFAVEGLPR